MYIEHPYFYEGKYYANIDGEMIEVTKEVAYAMNNFYRSSKAKKVEIKNEEGKVVDKMLREVPYSGQSIDGEGFMIEDFPDLNCDVEHSVLTKMEQQDSVYYICSYAHIGMCKWYTKDRGGKIRAEDNRRKCSCSN